MSHGQRRQQPRRAWKGRPQHAGVTGNVPSGPAHLIRRHRRPPSPGYNLDGIDAGRREGGCSGLARRRQHSDAGTRRRGRGAAAAARARRGPSRHIGGREERRRSGRASRAAPTRDRRPLFQGTGSRQREKKKRMGGHAATQQPQPTTARRARAGAAHATAAGSGGWLCPTSVTVLPPPWRGRGPRRRPLLHRRWRRRRQPPIPRRRHRPRARDGPLGVDAAAEGGGKHLQGARPDSVPTRRCRTGRGARRP